MYYQAEFHTTCEECGESYDGIAKVAVEGDLEDDDMATLLQAQAAGEKEIAIDPFIEGKPERDPFSVGSMSEALLESEPVAKAKRILEENAALPPYEDIEFEPLRCPHCGAVQSWRPLIKPMEPTPPPGPGALMVIMAVILGIAGVLVGFFALSAFKSTLIVILPAALGIMFGLFVGKSIHKATKADDLRNFKDAMAAYPEKLEDYEEFASQMANRERRHQPAIDLATGRFSE